MIVADTNLIAHLFIESDFSAVAQQVVYKDADWIAPILWRSEFRNVLANYLRVEKISLENALFAMQEAEKMLRGKEYRIHSDAVLALVASTKHSAYDCEFAVLAQAKETVVVTADKRMLRVFPDLAVSPAQFVNSS